jgi:hypothetical protein
MHSAERINEELRNLTAYAQQVLAALKEEQPTANPNVAALRQRLGQTAAKTLQRATAPVTIGVVGEFSSGKTLLLGGLVGYADALPVSAKPSTGNVTALRFTPVDGLRTTELTSFTIDFLTEEGLRDCLRHMLAEARQRSRVAQVGDARLASVEEKVAGGSPAAWAELVRWGQEAWAATPNPGLRRLVRELVWLARAASALPGVLGQRRDFDRETALEGLQLAPALGDIAKVSFDNMLASLPPVPPQPLGQAPDTWSVALLRAAFPLIRRVEIGVRLSREIWDLSRLRGVNEFVLLDFPGLGAADSGVRDTFLCMRELQNVQTILILLNGLQPGAGREAQEIFDLLQQQRPQQNLKNFVLVGVSRFDDLPLEAEGREQILDQLLVAAGEGGEGWGDDTAGVGAQEVLGRLDVLQALVAAAQALTEREDRIVFLSSLLALGQLPRDQPGFRPGSDEFLASLDMRLPRARQVQAKWKRLGGCLRDGGHLGRWLTDFAADGGLGRLRELVESHVASHGLRQLLADAAAAAQEVYALQRELDRAEAGDGPAPAGRAETEALQKAVNDLQLQYNQFDSRFRNAHAELRVERNGRRVPLLDALSEEVDEELVGLFFRWQEWFGLLGAYRDGRVQPARRLPPGGWGEDDPEAAEPAVNTLPSSSEDLFPPFDQTVRALEKVARDKVRGVIDEVLESLSAQLLPARAAVLAVLRSPEDARARVQARNYPNEAAVVRDLFVALEPKKAARKITTLWGAEGEGAAPLHPGDCYPLPRAAGSHRGRLFPWSPEHRGRHGGGDHLVQVLRLRNEFIASVQQPVTEQLCRLTRRMVEVLGEFVGDMLQVLLNLSGNNGLLACLAGESPEGTARPRSKAAAVPFPRTALLAL